MADPRTLSYHDTTQTSRGKTITAPYLAVTLDCRVPLMPPARYSLAAVERTVVGRDHTAGYRNCARFIEDGIATQKITFDDAWMSSDHTHVVRTELGWSLVDRGSKNGTFLNGTRIDSERLRDGDVIEIGAKLILYRECTEWSIEDDVALDLADDAEPLVGLATLSVPLVRRLDPLRRVAEQRAPILIFGESGTGKEVIARAVHALSRRSGPFVAVNCGALTEGLVESQLFGHRKGAFSGADTDHTGLVRTAARGTLLLDEIAELPEGAQIALLRVLQEGEVTPVGATRPIKVDIRVLAATHQDIDARRRAGLFRDDLYARLAGFSVQLPRLAERREDIGLITGTLLRRLAGERADRLQLARDAARALVTYDWPLNIRELEHALAAALALGDGDTIELAALPPAVGAALSRRPG